jgi:hypothetical protein
MNQNTTELERAFQLAKSGCFATVDLIRHQLKSEGYSTAHVTGKGLTKQLVAIIRSAKAPQFRESASILVGLRANSTAPVMALHRGRWRR